VPSHVLHARRRLAPNYARDVSLISRRENTKRARIYGDSTPWTPPNFYVCICHPLYIRSLTVRTYLSPLMDLNPTPVTTHSKPTADTVRRRCITQGEGSGKSEHHKRGVYDARGAVGGKVVLQGLAC